MENSEYGVRKGSWTEEEDTLLRICIEKYGEGKWHQVPLRAGLNRCRKSCRLRWLNYLRPNIRRGPFEPDEVDLIIRMHKLLGNKWALIAGRLPGRTANDIKNFWNTHLNKKAVLEHGGGTNNSEEGDKATNNSIKKSLVVKPQPLTFSKNSSWIQSRTSYNPSYPTMNFKNTSSEKERESEFVHREEEASSSCWWESILFGHEDNNEKLEQEIAADKYSNCHMTTILESKEHELYTDLWDVRAKDSSMEGKQDVETSIDLDHLFSDENFWATFGLPE